MSPDVEFMARALQLARRGLYTTDPNPRVGCVVVADGEIAGEGWHQRAGEAHAEVVALAAAGERARGATAYVTLEPCCHVGRTGPCTEELVEAGVARVVAAMTDPNPRVAGQGLARLREAGIAAEAGLLETDAAALNAGFVKRMTHGLPFVRLKVAASLDGRTALASGESQWITGAAARADGHRLRARSSAVLVGIGTALADDPQLTARDTGFPVERQPVRVVLDGDLRLPSTARMLNDGGRTIVFAATDAASAEPDLAGATVECVDRRGDHLNLEAVLRRLAELECNEVLVEAGAQLNGALLAAGLVDEVVVYLAPTLLGDAGRGMFSLPALATLADRPRLRLVDQRPLGDDWRLTYVPEVEN